MILFNISGPYAVGKDSVLNAILERYGDRVHRVRTLTTRPVDPDVDPSYEAVSPEEFEARVAVGNWLTNRQLSGKIAYGTSVDEIEAAAVKGLTCIHSIYAGPQGAGSLRRTFGGRLYSVGLVPTRGTEDEQLAELERRLLQRGRDSEAIIRSRLTHQLEPLSYVSRNPQVPTADGILPVFDEVVSNEALAPTIDHLVERFSDLLPRKAEG